MESPRWVLLGHEKSFEIALWRHKKNDFSKKKFFHFLFFKIYLVFCFLPDQASRWLKMTGRWQVRNPWEHFFRFFSKIPTFFQKSAKNIFFRLFWKKIPKIEKNQKFHFQRFGCTDNTQLLRYRPAWSDKRASLKKFFRKKFFFFEKSIFLWRHNAIFKNFSQPSRTHLRDSIDTSFVQIGQEMRKWQPKSYKKRENRKSLGPPLKVTLIKGGGYQPDFDFSRFCFVFSTTQPFIDEHG